MSAADEILLADEESKSLSSHTNELLSKTCSPQLSPVHICSIVHYITCAITLDDSMEAEVVG